MSKYAETHALDVDDFEVVRSIHRVVRAMHDGECPKCHWIFESSLMRGKRVMDHSPVVTGTPESVPVSMDMVCPACGFTITDQEARAAIDKFAPVMERNLAVFEEWRKTLLEPVQQITPAELLERVKMLPPEERERAKRMLLLKYAKPGESEFVDKTRAVLEKTPTQ